MKLVRIESRLTEAIGVDPATLSRAGLQGAVRRRMEIVGTSSVEAYVRRLRRDAHELDLLAASVLVHETSFYRYPASFDLLVEEARTVLQSDPARVFRIRCVACATGEEPASAVCQFENGLSGPLPGARIREPAPGCLFQTDRRRALDLCSFPQRRAAALLRWGERTFVAGACAFVC